MRSSEDVGKDIAKRETYSYDAPILGIIAEMLLDIRDLLAKERKQ